MSAFNFVERTTCPACRSPASRTRYSSPFDEGPVGNLIAGYYRVDPSILKGHWQIEQCGDCGTYYQAEIGDEAALTTLYTDWMANDGSIERDPGYAFDVANPELSRDGHEVMVAAAYHRLALPRMRTLDYGMGWASWARISAALGCQSYGFDLSQHRLDFAAQHGVKPHQDGQKYHFINTEQLVEHVADPPAMIAKLAAALLPGGVLKISVPAPRGIDALLTDLVKGRSRLDYPETMPIFPLEHINTFSREGLKRLVGAVGLELVRPNLSQSYAFVGRGLSLREPRRLLKELVRPIYQWNNATNLYVWARKRSA